MKGFKEYIKQFSHIKEDTFVELRNNFQQTHLSKNEVFAREGEYANQTGFLEAGIIRAFIRNPEGKEYTKQFFIGPSIIGAYTSLLTKHPNRIIQQALTNCTIWKADYANIEQLYDRHHDLERLGRKIAEHYYIEKEKNLIEMTLLDADKRYLILKERFPNIESYIPQYYIASYLGISPTQLSRIRKKMMLSS